jgi:hypothetical protein
LDVLRQVLGRPEEELEVALEEASAAAIIEEHSAVGASVVYRFGHAFFRETLYEEIVATRRIRLHQQVASALEDVYVRRIDEHAAKLAQHYSFYSDTLNLSKAVHFGELAARRATEVFAYGDAAHQLEHALVMLDVADPDNKEGRCDLLLALGDALLPAGDTQRVVVSIAPEALTLAETLNETTGAVRSEHVASRLTRSGNRPHWRGRRCPNACRGPSARRALPSPRALNAFIRIWH